MTTITCATCRVSFDIPDGIYSRRHDGETGEDGRSHGGIYCPNGHRNVWDKKPSQALVHEREVKDRYRDQASDARQELWQVKQWLRTCPACGWRSRKQLNDRVRADFAQHLSESHSLAITEDLEEAFNGS